MIKIIEVLKVSSAKTVSQILYPDSTNPHSKIVQVQKQLNTLVGLGKIKRGSGWYSTLDYQGEFKSGGHDRLLTALIAQLLCLKLPVTVFREISFPVGIRSDLVALIGKNGKALCVVIEACNNETDEYLQMKYNLWKSWEGANRALSELFKANIPHFSVVISRNQPDDGFSKLIGELK